MINPDDRKRLDSLINHVSIILTSGRLNISMTEPKSLEMYEELFSKLLTAVTEIHDEIENMMIDIQANEHTDAVYEGGEL